MRIIIVNYELPPLGGGAGNATANVAREMAALGHEVTVLTSLYKDLPRNEVIDGYRVRRVWTVRRRVDRCTPLEMLVFMVSAIAALPRFIRLHRPSTIIAFFGIPSGPVAWVGKFIFGVPYIISLRGGDVPGYQPYDLDRYHRLLRPVIVALWRAARVVVANSGGLRDLANLSTPDLPIAVVPNGVDAIKFHPSGKSQPRSRIRLVFVGRLQHQKGVDVLLRAMGRLARPDLELLIVGDGPDRNLLTSLAAELSLERNVIFRGWAEKAELPDLYRSGDIFVLPSRDEGMPNVLLEAMASGLPAVATRISGSEELVVHGETGLLVPPEDADALAAALAELSDNAALRTEFGRRARSRVEHQFTWRAVAEAYLQMAKNPPDHARPSSNRTVDAV
ncbi:glycosyltransferase family 4 protein [Microvirga rosea]|uniref:glycosyltransferase family 4 protein n=1 Tax=Microvirga rosea TaxID=2715425 RepID=UPI001D09FD56|nr:glycosyltransferase family 4 protein [Microvirga rosea]MCB8820201.1 glycosyltransferase family 4 protein [Microvirga rosea]